jgi:tRNA threonylcarbamoyladenosine biosynthesis protein TsaB
MLILALDTSGDVCFVAVADDGRERASYYFQHERRLSERLSAILAFVLRDAGTSLRDIEAFAVGRGPGSFTGVRVGVTLAKTFALALGRPVIGISSLDALAEPLSRLGDAAPAVAAVTPTRRGEVVAAYYRAGEFVPVASPSVTRNDEVVPRARKVLGEPPRLVIAGETAALEAAAAEGAVPYVAAPSAAALVRLAALRIAQGDVDDPDTLVPLYVTPSPVG